MRDERTARWVAVGLVVAATLLLAPLLPAVMLALWLAALARVVHEPLVRAFGGRTSLAAATSVIALTAVMIPFVFVITSLAADAYQLVTQLLQSPRGKLVLEQLVSGANGAGAGAGAGAVGGGEGPGDAMGNLWEVLMSQQERAWVILQRIAGTAARVVIALVVILSGVYAVLVDGARAYRWFEHHAPIPPAMLARLRDAFYETGRGLFVGIGGAGLLQGAAATLIYLIIGIPRAFELGLLTFCFSIIPTIGTAIVWVPLAAGLALTGRTGAAIALAICGVVVIGTVDNLIRPLLARRGQLQLPTYVVLIAMFAGVSVLGAWGLLIAPLAVRLARAALETPGVTSRDLAAP